MCCKPLQWRRILVAYPDPAISRTLRPHPTLPLSGLSSVRGTSVVSRFDGGMLSSTTVGFSRSPGGKKRLRIADRLACCIDDPRCPDQVIQSVADMIGFRMKMIAAGSSRRCAGWRTCSGCGNWSLWAV